MNVVLVQYPCMTCGGQVTCLSDGPQPDTCESCRTKVRVKAQAAIQARVLGGNEFLKRKAELEARHGTIHGKRRWEKLDPDCYVPLYY